MPVPPTSGRLQWIDVPAPLRARIKDALGALVTDTVTPGGGCGHQLAAALTLADGRRAFVKAAPDDDPLTAANVHEAAVLDSLPPGAPAPNLLGIHHAADWTAVVIAHLDGPHPDLSPASGDAEQTWTLLDKLTSSPAPAPYAAAVNDTSSTTAALRRATAEATDERPPAHQIPEPRRLLVEVTADDRESAPQFFKEASAVCWKDATDARPGGRGSTLTYYLHRFLGPRTRTAPTH